MRPVVLMSLLILSATVLSSCNILTPIAIIFAPDPKVEAEYELQDRPTVVFVDDRQSLVTPTSLRRIIADRVSQDLMVKEILTTTISTTDAEAIARQGDTSGNPMPIDAIGRSVGAEQVIYIEVLEFKDRTDRFTPQPRSTCRIRVIGQSARGSTVNPHGRWPRVAQACR